MSPNGTQARDPWLLESIRATLFPAAGEHATPDGWWEGIVGRAPDTRTVRPATREFLEQGELEGRQLVLTVNPLGVIQWVMGPLAPKELPSDYLAAGPLQEVRDLFGALIERWLPSSPRVQRLAFGAVALLPVGGHLEAYQTLDRYLRSVEVDPNSSDLLYRINRPRPSTTHESHVLINRLSTWMALKMSLVIGEAVALRSVELVNERYALRVELDINTVPAFPGTFTPVECGPLFHELEQLGMEIIERGDIP